MTERKRPSPAVRLAAVSAFVLLAGCSLFEPKSQVRGNKIDPDTLAELTPGTSTRADASALLGSPTARATFDDNSWIYIAEITRPRIARTQGVEDMQVVVLRFDGRGVLQDIRKLNQDDSLPVSVVSRSTPSPGSDASIMQQLFGNIGRFSPGGLGGPSTSTEGPSGGAPSP